MPIHAFSFSAGGALNNAEVTAEMQVA